jgi:hypothetical protein
MYILEKNFYQSCSHIVLVHTKDCLEQLSLTPSCTKDDSKAPSVLFLDDCPNCVKEEMREALELLLLFKEAVRQVLVENAEGNRNGQGSGGEEVDERKRAKLVYFVKEGFRQALKDEEVGKMLEEIVKRGLKDVLSENDCDVGEEVGNGGKGREEGEGTVATASVSDVVEDVMNMLTMKDDAKQGRASHPHA